MTSSVLHLSPKKLAAYRDTALRRQKARASGVKLRMRKGWKLARLAAQILREQYHAERVAVFGSLLREASFTKWSDVDIAAWGIPPELTFRAIGAVMDLDSSFEVNLVDVNTCSPSLLNVIEREGVEI